MLSLYFKVVAIQLYKDTPLSKAVKRPLISLAKVPAITAMQYEGFWEDPTALN